jgi:hypothetical protein
MAMETVFMRFNRESNLLSNKAARRETRYGGISSRYKSREQSRQLEEHQG